MSTALLDANTLLLWIVGNVEPTKVGVHRRLRQFQLSDLSNLRDQLAAHTAHVTLPNILTEVSNLIGSGTQSISEGALYALAAYGTDVSEVYQPSSEALRSPYYRTLGLTDAAIELAASRDLTVFTVDHELDGRLRASRIPVVNLWHFAR